MSVQRYKGERWRSWRTARQDGRSRVRFLMRVLGRFQMAYSFSPHSKPWGPCSLYPGISLRVKCGRHVELVVPNVKVGMEAQHSIPPLILHELLPLHRYKHHVIEIQSASSGKKQGAVNQLVQTHPTTQVSSHLLTWGRKQIHVPTRCEYFRALVFLEGYLMGQSPKAKNGSLVSIFRFSFSCSISPNHSACILLTVGFHSSSRQKFASSDSIKQHQCINTKQ